MFKFLKNKIKDAVKNITGSAKDEVKEEKKEDKPKKKPAPKKKAEKPAPKKPKVEKKPEIVEEPKVEEKIEEAEQPEEVQEVVEEPVVEEKKEEIIEEPEVVEEVIEEPEEVPEPIVEEQVPEEKPKKGFFSKLLSKKEELKEEAVEEPEEKKGFLTKLSEKVTTIQLSEEKFNDLFWELELALLENNVAVSVIEKIKEDLKQELTTGRTARGNLEERIYRRLEESLREVLSAPSIDLLSLAKEHKPLVIAAIGVNGSGKTTSLAKLANYFQKNNLSVVLAACDTFRAAAIQQLEEHANNLRVPIIKQEYGADAAAVAFDAVKHAESKKIDVVLIDTAGRLHSNTNLMDELAKVMRVAKPNLTLFVGEAVTGNDCVEQAEQFSEKTPIDGIILTKSDVDEKGGAAVSISHVTGKPIVFLGVGQSYNDFEVFSADKVIQMVLPDQ